MIKYIRDLFKCLIILVNFVRLGAWRILFVHKPDKSVEYRKLAGKNLGKFFESMGPSFVKFGQVLSIRSDLLPQDCIDQIGYLRDDLKPFAFKRVKSILEKDFGCELEELFDSFDETPVASASVAQVHKAVFNGEAVAVKVLRPGVKKKLLGDIKLLCSVMNLCHSLGKLKRIKVKGIFDVLEESIKRETDLLLEASAMEQIGENMKLSGVDGVAVPKVFFVRSSVNCLTMEWVEGVSLLEGANPSLQLSDHDKKIAADILIRALFSQVIIDGLFHADLHAGNVFFKQSTKTLIILDFGIVSYINSQYRDFLIKVFKGFIEKDYDSITNAHIEIGMLDKKHFLDFSLSMRMIGDTVVGKEARDIAFSKLLTQLIAIAERFNIKPQPPLLLFHKTLISAEGISRQINPSVNIWDIIGDVTNKFMKENYRSMKAFTKRLKHHKEKIKELLFWLEDLPERNKKS